MAVGFSGSGGGLSLPIKKVNDYHGFVESTGKKFNLKYVDYFVNNICNLNCKHCYVSYKNKNNDLTIREWYKTFDSCIDLGARVFGNVGKEPLLTWKKTRSILKYFKNQKENINEIKFGLVTNGLLINDKISEELKALNLDYIDISIDGNENIHDMIRGEGTYRKTIQNIAKLVKSGLQDNIFISYTLNKLNLSSFLPLVQHLSNSGISNFLGSPYLTNHSNDKLELTTEDYTDFVRNILKDGLVNLSDSKNVDIHIRNDFRTSKFQNALLENKIIDTDKLIVDNNNALYYICNFNKNNLIFNLQTWNPDFLQALRISHDGYVSNCFDMFFPEYTRRAIGNVRKNSLTEIIKTNSDSKKSNSDKIRNITVPTTPIIINNQHNTTV